MSTGEYEAIPEDEWKALATTEITHLTDEEKEHLPRAWDEWIARVRRDAARGALDGAEKYALRRHEMSGYALRADGWRFASDAVRDYRDAHYPEETP